MRQELSTPALLRVMRVTLHLSFAALLGLAVLRTLMQPSGDGATTAAVSYTHLTLPTKA